MRAIWELARDDARQNAEEARKSQREYDDAVTRLNELEQSARQGQDAVTDSQNGRAKLSELAETLASQVRQAQGLEAQARATIVSSRCTCCRSARKEATRVWMRASSPRACASRESSA